MPEVRSELTLTIDEALASVEQLRAEIDSTIATPISLEVVADASDATSAVSELGTEAEGAAGQTSELSTELGGFDAAAGVAAGSAGALVSELEGLGGTTGAVVGAVAAVGASLAVFFTQGVQAEGASQRMDAALGGLRQQVERINVGSLNADLSELALSLGGDDDALRQAATSFFQLGTSAGFGGREVAKSTEQIIALSARAVALKPELGDIADVADGLSRALSRGGRFAANFGIDLSAAEISARALADSGKATAAELTFYEKAAAGAALATEKYGQSLDTVIAEGAQNSIITLARLKQTFLENIEALGMPIISPIFELLEELTPAATAVGQALATVGAASLPIFTVALQALTPILTAFANGLSAIPTDALTAVIALLAISRALKVLQATLVLLSTGAMINPFIALAAIAITVAGALGLAGDAADDTASSVQDLGKASDESLTAMAESIANTRDVMEQFGKGADVTKEALARFKTTADEDVTAATRFGEALVAAGVITEGQFTRVIDGATAAQVRLGQSNRDSAASLAALVETAVGTLPTLGSVLATTESQLDGFGLSLDSAASPAAFLTNLQASIQGVLDFNTNLALLAGQGLTDTAAALAEQGPKVGGAQAKAILDGSPITARAIETTIRAQRRIAENEADTLSRILGPKFRGAFDKVASEGRKGGEVMGDRYVAGVRSRIANAEAAGRALAQATNRGIRTAGSPSEHLFFDAGASMGAAFQSGLASTSSASVGVGAITARNAVPTSNGAAAGITVGTIQVEVHGVSDPAAARAAGVAAGQGVRSGLSGETRRALSVAVRTG